MRIRSIKPEFWTDSFMVHLPPLARLVYIALWTAADDHGFIKDEPERLAMELFPREDVLVFDDWFQFFAASGRLQQFATSEGAGYFKIGKWEAHQRVDKPSKSRIFQEGSRKLAAPLETRRKVAEKYGCEPGAEKDVTCYYCGAPGLIHWHRLHSGRPSGWVTFPGLELDHLEAESVGGEGVSANLVLACRHCNRAKGARHWLDVLCLVNGIPLGTFESAREASMEEGKGREQGKETEQGGEEGASRPPACPVEKIIALYHERLPANPKCVVVNETRRRHIRGRWEDWRKAGKYQGVEDGLRWWGRLFEYIGNSAFLTGRSPPAPGRDGPFFADVDFIFRPEKNVAIVEGKYHTGVAA